MLEHIFGPVVSRRFGLSLGVDLSPQGKVCNFDCVYCELGKGKIKTEIPNPSEPKFIANQVKNALQKHKNIDVITITSNGEPTLYPYLGEFAREIKKFKNDKKLLILSNGTGVLNPQIFSDLLEFDVVKFSLDSACKKSFAKVDRANFDPEILIEKMTEFSQIFKGDLVLEILVVSGINDTKDEFEKLNLAIEKIAPKRVDVSSIHRPPAYDVKGVEPEKLSNLASLIVSAPVFLANPQKCDEKFNFSKDEILNLLKRRPQSIVDVEQNYSTFARQNMDELVKFGLVKQSLIAGVLFYELAK